MALCAVLLAAYMLTDQPVLGQPYAVSVSGACMEACRAKLRMIMFASCLLCFFPARDCERGKDSTPNDRSPICNVAVTGGRESLTLLVEGREKGCRHPRVR
jgi:hypothetical protein